MMRPNTLQSNAGHVMRLVRIRMDFVLQTVGRSSVSRGKITVRLKNANVAELLIKFEWAVSSRKHVSIISPTTFGTVHIPSVIWVMSMVMTISRFVDNAAVLIQIRKNVIIHYSPLHLRLMNNGPIRPLMVTLHLMQMDKMDSMQLPIGQL